MLSEEANRKGPELVNITHAALYNFGIQIDNKMSGGNQKHAESNFVELIAKIQSPALEIMKKNALTYEQMAQSAAIATAFIIQQSKNITPEEGFGTAIYHYIEGSKTSPPDFNLNAKSEAKSWWKLW